MTWNDAITDALIAQASRNDLGNGAANLNTIATCAMALGGIVACLSAGSIELNGGDDIDPNIYFGTYMGLICTLLIASIWMNQDLEPEVILQQRMTEKYYKIKKDQQRANQGVPDDGIYDVPFESTQDSGSANEALYASCSATWSSICRLFRYREWYLPIFFFFIVGIVLPSFDDLHYIFLTTKCHMDKYMYDFLNTLTYVSLLGFVVLYN
jgi:hypothetical protein